FRLAALGEAFGGRVIVRATEGALSANREHQTFPLPGSPRNLPSAPPPIPEPGENHRLTAGAAYDRARADASPPTALSEREVARQLGLSVATVRAWRVQRKGPRFVRFGRAVRYRQSDIDQFVRTSLVETDRRDVSAFRARKDETE